MQNILLFHRLLLQELRSASVYTVKTLLMHERIQNIIIHVVLQKHLPCVHACMHVYTIYANTRHNNAMTCIQNVHKTMKKH